MARKKSRAVSLTPSPFKVAFLLSQFILYKTGLTGIWVTGILIFGLRSLVLIIFKVLTFRTGLVLPFISGVILIYASFLSISSFFQSLPSPKALSQSNKPLTTEFYDRNGMLLYRLYEEKNRSLIKLDELPPFLIQATIAIEDKHFYKHPGFDIGAILRALYQNTVNKRLDGASTITQQLIKNTLLTPEKTITRKVKEIILAFWAERMYTKEEILEMYFNEVPYGGPTWGVEAAAKVYFGKGAAELNLPEASFLAGLPASPTQFSPYGERPDLAKLRQIQVLEKMGQQGYISESQKNEAISKQLDLKPPTNNILAPHFVFYVKDILTQKYGPRMVSRGGLKIYTSLDLDIQQAVERIVSSEVDTLKFLNVTNGAAMVTDAKTGQILAMVGSKDYYRLSDGNFNVTLSLRQPGSSIKPVTYATVFKMGFTPGNTILDTPFRFRDELGQIYAPVNYDGKFRGPVSIRQALGSSLNLPAVKLLHIIGIDEMIKTAKSLGITTFDERSRFGLSLTLGGGEVKMIEMMGVYGAFADYGRLHKPTAILKVLDPASRILEEFSNLPKQAVSSEIAFLITNILSDNNARRLAFGPDSLLNIGPNIAVKTGTSDNKRDNWTFGYTTDLVVGVWVGNNDNSPMHPSLTSGITGAAPVWNKITKMLIALYPGKPFTQPSGITQVMVDGRKDLAIEGMLPKRILSHKSTLGEN